MYTNERYEAGHDHALLKLRKEFEKHRAAENNPHNLNLEAMDYRNYTRDALDLPISNDAADAFAGTVASIKARIIDPYDGNVEISFFNADGEQLGKTEFSMDSEKAISSVELDAAHRRLVFNRFALAPLYCSLEDLYSLLDGYKEQIDLNTANIAINSENIAINAEKIAENAEKIAEEEIRAAGAEKRIEDGLTDEIRRATIAEAVLRTSVSDEAQAREDADNGLASAIEAEASARESADSLLQTAIREEMETRVSADAAEASERASADADLLSKIEKEISDREAAIALKQDKLAAGDHITIDSENKISAAYELVTSENPGLMPSGLFNDVNEGLEKLAGIEAGAQKNVQADWNEESDNSDAYIKNKPEIVSYFINDAHYQTDTEVAASIAAYHDDTKVNDADLAAVAKSGSYNDLADKPNIPVIPTDISAFNNDVGYLTEHQSLTDYAKKSDLEDYVKSEELDDYAKKSDLDDYAKSNDLADVAFSGSYNDLADKPAIYTKPETGIPATDLEQDVQDDLSSISEHISDTDIHVTANDKSNWNGKSVVSGEDDGTNWTSITINGDKFGIPSGGSGGTTDYSELTNKPQINGHPLVGNQSSADLGLASAGFVSGIASGDNWSSITIGGDTKNIPAPITSYSDLNNKPKIGGKELSGDKSAEDLGLVDTDSLVEYVNGEVGTDGNWKTITIGNETHGFPTSEEPVKPVNNLGNWWCTRGAPEDLDSPYSYIVGDYFTAIDVEMAKEAGHVYKPSGRVYTGGHSEAVETEDIAEGAIYVFDGEDWILYHEQPTSVPSINNVPLVGNKTSEDLGIVDKSAFDSHVEEFNELAGNVDNHIGDSTHITTEERTAWNGKSVVSVANTGASESSVHYITINGIESKLDAEAINIIDLEEDASLDFTTDSRLGAVRAEWASQSSTYHTGLEHPRIPTIDSPATVVRIAKSLLIDRKLTYVRVTNTKTSSASSQYWLAFLDGAPYPGTVAQLDNSAHIALSYAGVVYRVWNAMGNLQRSLIINKLAAGVGGL